MDISSFYQVNPQGIFFSKQQGSDFAKQIANDFNPIHDIDAKKFCVPGDLLFSVILSRYGLHQEMCFHFSGMVGDGTFLDFPETGSGKEQKQVAICDLQGKEYLNFSAEGNATHDAALIHSFIDAYVKFSGKAFPHLLVPLMQAQQVMINPDRPLVVYESMSVKLERLDIDDLQVSLFETGMKVEGKRGKACLQFDLLSGNKKIGCGKKNMILSGLRAYDDAKMQQLIKTYQIRSQNIQI